MRRFCSFKRAKMHRNDLFENGCFYTSEFTSFVCGNRRKTISKLRQKISTLCGIRAILRSSNAGAFQRLKSARPHCTLSDVGALAKLDSWPVPCL